MNENLIEKLHETELSILMDIDKFCKKYAIRYSLYGGTLLGAVRHKGFIPWDDDCDICMLREEYDRFLSLWAEYGPKEYILQNKENTALFTQSFTKLRKKNTLFLTDEKERFKYHCGIFVDIFPIDRIPKRIFRRVAFQYRCMKYQLYTREFIPSKGILQRMVAKFLLKRYTNERRIEERQRIFQSIIRNAQNHGLNTVDISVVSTIMQPLPSDMFQNYTRLSFEGKDFMCVKKFDELLTIQYGDYMSLPPERERTWKHKPIRIEFEKNEKRDVRAEGINVVYLERTPEISTTMIKKELGTPQNRAGGGYTPKQINFHAALGIVGEAA